MHFSVLPTMTSTISINSSGLHKFSIKKEPSMKERIRLEAGISTEQTIQDQQANDRLITTLDVPMKRKEFVALVDHVVAVDKRPIVTFYNLLNRNPKKKKSDKLDEPRVLQFMKEYPDFCSDLFRFEAFHTDLIHPLHMLCALGASPALLRSCLNCSEAALFHDESALGAPIHYALNCRAPFEVVRWLVKKDIDALQIQNDSKGQLPLHVAVSCMATTETVAFLTDRCAAAALQADNDGMTPLHLACSVDKPVLAIVEDLTEVGPQAGEILSKDQETPLLVAIRLQADHAILKDLIISHPKAACIPDGVGLLPLHCAIKHNAPYEVVRDLVRAHPDGVRTWDNKKNKNLPVHMAVLCKCNDFDIYKLLARKYPDSLEMANTAGHTPHQYAALQKLDGQIVEFLNPFEEVDE
jgi:ankyrin repeat protein